jgi:hypothetical protein
MSKDEQKPMARNELLPIIEMARRENWEKLEMRGENITELPPEIGQLKRIPTYTGDYLWLCEKHYEPSQPKIPDRIE